MSIIEDTETTSSDLIVEPTKSCFEFCKADRNLKNIVYVSNNAKVFIHLERSIVFSNKNHIMLYLQLSATWPKLFTIRYRYFILNQNDVNCRILSGDAYFPLFNRFTKSHRYGGRCLIDEDFVFNKSNGFQTNDGKTKIYCVLEEIKNNSESIAKCAEPDHFTEHLETLLQSGKFSDVTLVVGDKYLFAHKNILSARSKYFKAMFDHDCEESRKNRVEITDMSIDVCEQMLLYIYTGKIPTLEEYAIELFVVSDKYQLELLHKICTKYLKDNITLETVVNVAVISNMLGSNDLESKCIDFITENSSKIKNSENWKILETKTELLAKLFLSMSDKQERLNELINNGPVIHWEPILESECAMDFSNEQVFNNKIQNDFHFLLKSGKFSDAIFLVEKTEIPVHKNILTVRSKEFSSLLAEQCRVQVANSICVQDCEAMLRYLYTGSTEFANDDCLPGLLKASNEFKLNHLKWVCEQKLVQTIDMQSVVGKYCLAEENEATFLKDKCLDFIAENTKQVIHSSKWKEFSKSNSELAIKVMENVAMRKW